MSKQRPANLLVDDIWDSLGRINRYTQELTQESFRRDEKTADAVVRNLEVIGEAARHLPEEFKERHPEIPWNKIAGLRNRIVHEYFGADLDIVWNILQNDLRTFKVALQNIREKLEKKV